MLTQRIAGIRSFWVKVCVIKYLLQGAEDIGRGHQTFSLLLKGPQKFMQIFSGREKFLEQIHRKDLELYDLFSK